MIDHIYKYDLWILPVYPQLLTDIHIPLYWHTFVEMLFKWMKLWEYMAVSTRQMNTKSKPFIFSPPIYNNCMNILYNFTFQALTMRCSCSCDASLCIHVSMWLNFVKTIFSDWLVLVSCSPESCCKWRCHNKTRHSWKVLQHQHHVIGEDLLTNHHQSNFTFIIKYILLFFNMLTRGGGTGSTFEWWCSARNLEESLWSWPNM